jgi:hypothetical protein
MKFTQLEGQKYQVSTWAHQVWEHMVETGIRRQL